MAIIHQASLSPTKAELLAAYLPTVPDYAIEPHEPIELVGAYRFDDPAGEVGVETHLIVTASGATLHVPLTYRSAPLDGADHGLVTTMQHSVLGARWVYDATTDPVYLTTLVATILTGGTHAPLMVETPDGPVERAATTMVHGTGSAGTPIPDLTGLELRRDAATSIAATSELSVTIAHVVNPLDVTTGPALMGTWPGQDDPAVLATVEV